MTHLSSLQACLFAGEACPKADRYILLSVLLACLFAALVYSGYQMVIKHSTSSKGLLRFTTLAIVLDLGVIIARFVETTEIWWPSAILTVLSTGAFYIGGITSVLNLLLKPILFMSIHIPFAFWILFGLYIGCFITSSVLLLVGVAAEVDLDYAKFNYYLGVYCAILSAMFALLILLISITTRLLLHTMKQINQRYDRHASLSAKRRRNLMKNSKRLALITLIEGGVLVAFSSTISGLLLTPSYSSANDSLDSIPIIWFFLNVSSIVLMLTYLVMFRSNSLPCWRRRSSLTAKEQHQQQTSRSFRAATNNAVKSAGATAAGSASNKNYKSAQQQQRIEIPIDVIISDVESQQPQQQSTKRIVKQRLQPIQEEEEDDHIEIESKEIPFLPNLIDEVENDSLYGRIGGQKALEHMVSIFLNRILEDDRVKDFFGQSSPYILRKKLEMFFILVTGGPALYSGRTLRETHAHLHISGETFEIVANHIKVSLETLQVPEQDLNLIMERVWSFRSEILGIEESAGMITANHDYEGVMPLPSTDTTMTTTTMETHALTVQ